MYYCFDDSLTFDYSIGEMAICKKNNNVILYNAKTNTFHDFNNEPVDIKGKNIFARTGVLQSRDIIKSIINQGGIPNVTNQDENIILNWPDYYQTKRFCQTIKGKQLITSRANRNIKAFFGNEIFFKTKEKNFSEIIDISLLKDEKCNFSKAMKNHLEDDFIISEKVNVLSDEHGKKEYRCIIINNEVYNISRFTTDVYHKIDKKIIDFVDSIKNTFPFDFVVDLFEYEKNGKKEIDVVEFNPITSAGLYLYNSCINKSDDLAHDNIENISKEFIMNKDVCTYDGQMIDNRDNIYKMPGSFAADLLSICTFGKLNMNCLETINITKENFASHKALYQGKMVAIDNDDMLKEFSKIKKL